MKSHCSLSALLLVLAAAGALGHEEHTGGDAAAGPPLILGVLEFPTSGAAEAQAAFERGVMLLHSFEYDDARAAFLEAQAVDPTFAMAIWGEAMTHNHPLWNRQDRTAALDALAKLAPAATRETSPLEARFIEAVQILYGDGSKQVRDSAYRDALAAMHADFPENLEVAAFYALSILGSVYERDFRTYMQAAAVAEEIFAKQPQHPGAAHYLIHSYDDQIHAPLGLRAARVYSKIAPSASHAQHMVSHIYTSLGMWDEVVDANAAAVRVSEEAMLRAGRSKHLRSKHALHWLEYALLQQGRAAEAIDTLRVMKEDVAALPDAQNVRHSAMMRATFVVEDAQGGGLFETLSEHDLPLYHRALDDFASAWRALARGELGDARLALDRIDRARADATVKTVAEGLHEDPNATSADDYLLVGVMARELESLLAFHAGDTARALEVLDEAIEAEASRPLYYGPPHVPKPADELKGEMLLLLGRPAEAVAMFEHALARHTARTLSLLGLARAQDLTRDADAAESWRRLETQWRGDVAALRALSYSWLPGTVPATAVSRR